MLIEGIVHGIEAMRFGKGARRELSLDELGGVLVGQAGLKYGWLARNNRIFGGTFGTGTAIAPQTATPTTTSDWNLYNVEPDGGRDYYIIQVGCHLVSGTAGLGMNLVGTVSLVPQRNITTPPTSYASSVISSLCGGPADTKAIFDQATTLGGGTPAWVTLASRDQVSAVSLGGMTALVDGFMKVPPGHVGGFAIIAPVGTTALFGVDMVWAEF